MNDAINSTCSHPINTNRVDIICLKALIIHAHQYCCFLINCAFKQQKLGEKTFNLEANELRMKKTLSMRERRSSFLSKLLTQMLLKEKARALH